MDPKIVVTPSNDQQSQLPPKPRTGRRVTIQSPQSLSRNNSKGQLQADPPTARPLSATSESKPTSASSQTNKPIVLFPQKQQEQTSSSRRRKSIFEPKSGSQETLSDSSSAVPTWQLEEKRKALVNVPELRELFRRIDVNGDRTLSSRDLAITLKKIGMESSESELINLFTEIELMDMANGVDWDLFQRVFTTCATERPGKTKETSRREVMKSFALFEKKPNEREPSETAVKPGKILVRDFYKMLTETCDVHKRMTPEEASDLLVQIAPNLKMDDYFDYKLYVNQMFS